MEPWVMWVVHTLGGVLSVVGGGVLTAWVLGRLRSAQTEGGLPPLPDVPQGAGQVIGWAERALAYVTVLAGAWAILSVIVALKTFIRYPEVKVEADLSRTEGRREVRFAEYYLVGTLVSLAVGVGLPLILRGIVGTPLPA